jgi:hypothetical protein
MKLENDQSPWEGNPSSARSAANQKSADGSDGAESASLQEPKSFLQERPPQAIRVAPDLLRRWTRRDLLIFGTGAIAALIGGGLLLPQTTLERL